MAQSQFSLFGTRRFLPLFLTQFLGAVNDNLFKNALVLLILYDIAGSAGLDGQVLVTVAAGVFILPFFLFSATAGQCADRFEKSALIRWIKAAEIGVMGLGAASILSGGVSFQIGVLFLMGTQSAFFGPVKYSILPDQLRDNEIIGGNALVEAGTFAAILIGTIAGGLLILRDGGPTIVAFCLVGLAIAGFTSSLFLPKAPAPSPNLRINPNIVAETWSMIKAAKARRDIFLSILGISWFWLVGATLLSQIPAFAKDVLGTDETVVTLFLTLFSVGIALGALLCNRLLKGEVSGRYIPAGALGMTLCILDLYAATRGASVTSGPLVNVSTFVAQPYNWRIIADLLGVSISAGLFTVPLYAILQTRGEATERSRTIAANNILNAAFMVVGAIAAAAMLSAGLTVQTVFLVVAVTNGVVAIYICRLLPDALIKGVLVAALKVLYRVEVRGLENYAAAGRRAVIVVNHLSFIDALLLAAFLPGKPMFAVNTHTAKLWWVAPFLKLLDTFPMDPTNAMATKALIKAVREDRHCVIFPEGRLTVTGTLMRVYEGPGMIAHKADAMLLPVRIDGAQYTPFSRLAGKVRIRWFPKIRISVLPPRRFDLPESTSATDRRKLAAAKLYDEMSEMVFETSDRHRSLFQALLEASKLHGPSKLVVEDADMTPLPYKRLILGSLVLGRKLAARSDRGERVGVLLPNAVGTAVTFFGLQAFGRVPAMLNFSTGDKNMLSALAAAEIRTVITSRRFVKEGEMHDTVRALAAQADIVYLEDVRDTVSTLDKLRGLVDRTFARLVHGRHAPRAGDPAVVLFTSGSEGTPKGVVLSHANLLANRYQLASRVDFNGADTVFNALPMFHSFGLTGGTLLPILSGVRTFLYPSPLHYRIVPAMVYGSNATILFGTDTFLAGYARSANPYDFFSVRHVFAGAEKVKDETRKVWADKFGLRILEGYGATETAPVLAVNTPIHYRAGSVGRLMPGVEYRLEPVPGIETGGRLHVKGPNIMLGYLRAEAPGILEPPRGGWYDTGDIVSIDAEGFVTIEGRAKRFAKIAGEMVSLTAVEGLADATWPGQTHAAVALPDAKKGEQVVLVTDRPDATREALHNHAKNAGIAEIMVPKTVVTVDTVPLLGTGKVDYVGITTLASMAPKSRPEGALVS
jgi:acyl-[acyl-carrier-protein]-phospholipid O-acyltransferase/long-chain-fatty-acid--[acyl-carrier-protein] ligase